MIKYIFILCKYVGDPLRAWLSSAFTLLGSNSDKGKASGTDKSFSLIKMKLKNIYYFFFIFLNKTSNIYSSSRLYFKNNLYHIILINKF